MPTGYTAGVGDGTVTSFRQFALDCARAFGACITMRDDPGGGESIPEEFTPSLFYAEWLERARARLAAVEAMTQDDVIAAAANANIERIQSYRERVAQREETRSRYEAMYKAAQKWSAPTPEHAELRKFMLDQLSQSISFDCNSAYDVEPVPVTSAEWLATELANCRRDMERCSKDHSEEVERTAGRNAWIKALRESLP